MDSRSELYQQVILDHNKSPRNFKELPNPTHFAEGYNPLCGDHLKIYLHVSNNIVDEVSFVGDGCAISKASASMMTSSVKGKTIQEVEQLFKEFHKLVVGDLKPDKDKHSLGKLAIFSGIWQYPSRVKCASLCWHAMNGALHDEKTVSTE
jgi:nitrogen fixation NifU-like protein